MISNNRRREVAAELRKLADAECIRYAEEFYEELREIVAIDFDGSFEGVANSLADLIDRPTCRNVADPDDGSSFECSRCGEKWELTCGSPADNHLNYCPDCGAKVVS